MKKTNKTESKELSPLRFHTPLVKKDIPLFEENPQRLTPFFLRNVENWFWETEVSAFTIHYVLRGHLKFQLGMESIEEKSGGCLLLLPGQSIKATSVGDEPVSLFCAHFTQIPDEFDVEVLNHTQIKEVSLFESLTHHVTKQRNEKNGLNAEENVNHALSVIYDLVMLNLASPKMNATETQIESLIERVRSNPGGDWNVNEMALNLKMSRSRLTTWFNQLVGMSPNRFIIQQRIILATQWLEFSNDSVSEVAYRLGYKNPSFFTRQFKQVTGKSPSEYKM